MLIINESLDRSDMDSPLGRLIKESREDGTLVVVPDEEAPEWTTADLSDVIPYENP